MLPKFLSQHHEQLSAKLECFKCHMVFQDAFIYHDTFSWARPLIWSGQIPSHRNWGITTFYGQEQFACWDPCLFQRWTVLCPYFHSYSLSSWFLMHRRWSCPLHIPQLNCCKLHSNLCKDHTQTECPSRGIDLIFACSNTWLFCWWQDFLLLCPPWVFLVPKEGLPVRS